MKAQHGPAQVCLGSVEQTVLDEDLDPGFNCVHLCGSFAVISHGSAAAQDVERIIN